MEAQYTASASGGDFNVVMHGDATGTQAAVNGTRTDITINEVIGVVTRSANGVIRRSGACPAAPVRHGKPRNLQTRCRSRSTLP